MKTIYEAKSIVDFLLDRVGDTQQRRGVKSSLAKYINCQPSYLSQVLNGRTQLTLEQGTDTADFFQLPELDKDYFMLLLQKERAGHTRLEKYYADKMQKILDKKNNLAQRLKEEAQGISQEAAEKYYSSWHYLAVHILTSIPSFDNTKKISEHLGLTLNKTEQILQFLVQHDFVNLKDNKYIIGSRHIHLEKDNPLNYHHQMNWRLQALDKVKSKDLSEINYAGVYSLSKADADHIKENIIKLIKSNLKIVAPSKEEVMYCTIIDFFEI